jgi:transcriptional regulator with XRE-family HTH domain
MKKNDDLRALLSRNIKAARARLHITQEKLAEFAGISMPHMRDIENCRTWVSDKTLVGIARALDIEVYQLFITEDTEESSPPQTPGSADIASIINETSKILRKQTTEAMQNLAIQASRLCK